MVLRRQSCRYKKRLILDLACCYELMWNGNGNLIRVQLQNVRRYPERFQVLHDHDS